MLSIATAARTCPSVDYAAARAKFRAAVHAAGGQLTPYANPNPGPRGEELTADAAWFGPADAARVFVMVAGTHGAEGFCGSAGQTDWLQGGGPAALGPGTAALLIHAINPHGFAWIRRVTEENVDLNRNFVDFTQPLPVNPHYAALHDALIPADLEPATIAAAEGVITAFRDAHGPRALQQARGGGQYTHADGVFFGGREPTWARRTLERIIAEHRIGERPAVAVVDLHTGLGPFGYGEPINCHPVDSPATRRLHAWVGDSVTDILAGSSSSTPVAGSANLAWERACGDRVTFVALEFGTYPTEVGRAAQRADHWLHNRGAVDWGADRTQAIKRALRRHYNPDTPDWWEMVLFRTRQVCRQMQAGLAAS